MIDRHPFESDAPWAEVLADLRGSRWSDHFGRSDLGDNVFICRLHRVSPYLQRIGFPASGVQEMFGPWQAGCAFADGGWIQRRQSNEFGLVPGGLNGQWIIGFGALRYLCARFGLVPPRRLRGERFDLDPELLVDEVEAMLLTDRDALEARLVMLIDAGRYEYLADVMGRHTGHPHHVPGFDERQLAALCDATSATLLERCVRRE